MLDEAVLGIAGKFSSTCFRFRPHPPSSNSLDFEELESQSQLNLYLIDVLHPLRHKLDLVRL